ncbi:MAG: NAD-dependent deacylase [Bacteroidota bacterium]|nr:NAD-dependent deacylase [Bacteroidota bacterium]
MRKNIVVLSGAGISAESGIKTFRDAGGLWEGHSIEDVATFDAWERNPTVVLDFYNQRRKQLLNVEPNRAHYLLAELENYHEVQIITQNVDDLHERAGSTKVMHLHGELLKVRSTSHAHLVYPWTKDLSLGDLCDRQCQLRPHIVWFGEEVPLMDFAANFCSMAEMLIIIGTSLLVYPAAGLMHYTRPSCFIVYIDKDPKQEIQSLNRKEIKLYSLTASLGLATFLEDYQLLKD